MRLYVYVSQLRELMRIMQRFDMKAHIIIRHASKESELTWCTPDQLSKAGQAITSKQTQTIRAGLKGTARSLVVLAWIKRYSSGPGGTEGDSEVPNGTQKYRMVFRSTEWAS